MSIIDISAKRKDPEIFISECLGLGTRIKIKKIQKLSIRKTQKYFHKGAVCKDFKFLPSAKVSVRLADEYLIFKSSSYQWLTNTSYSS